MSAELSGMSHKALSGLSFEMNTVLCRNLSAKNFMNNDDMNVMASFLHVDFIEEDLFTIHVAPQFWDFF